MVLGQTAHFRALSLRNYYAKWCADSPIAQRLLAQRSRDSGQFRSLLDEEMLGAGLHQRTNWPTSYSKILESRASVSVSDVSEFSFRGNPGYIKTRRYVPVVVLSPTKPATLKARRCPQPSDARHHRTPYSL